MVIKAWVESRWFVNCILAVILFNAALLGLETSPSLSQTARYWVHCLDTLCIAIYVVEIGLKFLAYRAKYFRSGWRVFDLLIVTISVLPAVNFLTVLRALRVMRALRLVSGVPAMRRVVDALVHSLPGLASTACLLLLLFYISAVMATQLFQSAFPQWFGSVGESLYTLFQIMTLESWSMGIVRPILSVYPYAWMFFVPFILFSTFILLNFLIAIIVDAIAHLKHEEDNLLREQQDQDIKAALITIKALIDNQQLQLKEVEK